MHILFHIIVLFIFVFVLLMLNIPQIESDRYIKQKVYIFFGIFIFEFVINLLITIYKKCIVDLGRITKDSLQTALIATVAYSIYNDLVWSESPIVPDEENKIGRKLLITVLITVFVAIGYFIDIILTNTIPNMNDCINTIYPPKK